LTYFHNRPIYCFTRSNYFKYRNYRYRISSDKINDDTFSTLLFKGVSYQRQRIRYRYFKSIGGDMNNSEIELRKSRLKNNLFLYDLSFLDCWNLRNLKKLL